MDENGARQNETSSQAEPSTSTKRIRLAPLLLILAVIVLSFSCLMFFWNITSLALSYPNAELNGFDLEIESFNCGSHGRALIWASSVKFLSSDDVAQVESWYQKQGWQGYLIKNYTGKSGGGGIITEQDWQILDVLHWKGVSINQVQDSVQMEIRTMTIACLFGN